MQVPYSPVPGVAPSTSVPNDALNVQATPADAGAQVGQALQGVGSAVSRAGEETAATAFQFQTRFNNVASDAAFNTHQTNVNNILYGDPDHPDVPGYYGLHGQAALDARPGVQKALEESRASVAAGLNPAQALTFDEASRRLNMNSMNGVGAHYEQEFNRYAVETQNAGIDIKSRAVANGYNDDNLFLHNLEDAGRAADAKSALQGADPNTQAGKDIFANNRLVAAQTLYTARAVAMGTADPSAGLSFLQKNATQFDAITYHRLTDEFKTGADRAAVAGGIQMVMGGKVPTTAVAGAIPLDQRLPMATAAVAGTPVPPALIVAQAQQESQWDPSRRGAAGDRGLLQVLDTTAQAPGFTMAGVDPASLNDAAANLRFGAQYLYQRGKAAGLTDADWSNPAKVAIALKAYNGGGDPHYVEHVMQYLPAGGLSGGAPAVAGAAPAPAAPGVAGVPGTPGVVLASAAPGDAGSTAPAADATAAPLHSAAPFGIEAQKMQDARSHALELFPTRPDLQRQMVEGVWQEIQQNNSLQAKFEAETAKATRDAQEAAGQTFIKQIITSPKAFDPSALAADKSLTWEQKNNLFNIAQAHLKETAAGRDAITYGSGFWSAYQQVHSSDPSNRINDPSQLWGRGGANGDLTMAGIEKLTTEITSSRTPEGASYAQTVKDYLSAAHVAISGHGMFGGQRDAVGEMNFARFVPLAFAEIEKEKQAGMSPAQMMVKGGDLDKLAQQATRTPAQMMRDMLSANNPDLPGTPAAGAPATAPLDLTTAAGISAAYKAGHFGVGPAAYDKATQELQRRGFVKAPAAAPVLPSAPTQ